MSDEYVPLMVNRKMYKKLMNAFKKGKGCVLKAEHCNLEADLESGGNLFGAIKNIGNKIKDSKIGRTIAKEVVNKGVDLAKEQLSKKGYASNLTDKVLNTVKSEAGKQIEGAGMFDVVKKVANSKIGKKLQKEAIKGAKKLAQKKLAESGYSNDLTNAVLDAGSDYANKQVGGAMLAPDYLDRKAKGLLKMGKPVNHASALGVTQNPLEASYQGGRVAKGSQEAKDKMAKLRAMRGKKGGSWKF
jgi:hypothetical protein